MHVVDANRENNYNVGAVNSGGGKSLRFRQPSSWTRILIAVVVILLLTVIALAIALGVREASRPPDASPTRANECSTLGCIKAAARVSSWLDTKAKPCHDFFQFACGSWINNRVIPDEKSSLSTFTDLRDDMLVKVKRVLESSVMTNDSKANKMIDKMRKYYRNCLQRDKYGASNTSLTKLFSNVPLPFINATGWEDTKKGTNFEAFLATLAKFDVKILVSAGVQVDVRNSSEYIFSVDQPPLELDRRFFLEPKFSSVINALKSLIKKVLTKVYADLKVAGADDVKEDEILDLMTYIANETTPRELRRDMNKTDSRWTIKELKDENKNFNWSTYLTTLLSSIDKSLPDEYFLVVRAPEYVKKLDGIMKRDKLKDTVGRYATFILVERVHTMLGKEYREMFADFSAAIRGTRGDDTRWKQCANMIKDVHFRDVISRLYSQQYFDKASKEEALKMISYVRSAFYKLLKANKWMDTKTREVAAKKARMMLERIGYPDYIFNGTYLEDYYGVLPVTDDFFGDQLQILFISQERMLKKIWETVDRNRWMTQSVVVNAFYSPSFNQIYFPMGILASPFFDKSYPKYLNYGGIGAVIGHEITHGFDDGGRQRDENGNFRPWWSDSIVQAFKEAAQCIINQYNKYKAPITSQNITLNGVQTQGENIADNGGIKQSFEGYRDWIKKRGKPEPKLPGLPYTPEQLFFINYGQIWCSKMREPEWVQRILSGVHAPTMFRVIGTLSNTPHFQEAFKCQKGEKMNPETKCSVW